MTAKHHISRSFWHKGYVYLFTYVREEAMAVWSTHKCEFQPEGNVKSKMKQYREAFQLSHDFQVDGFIDMARKEREKEQSEKTVMDITANHKEYLN